MFGLKNRVLSCTGIVCFDLGNTYRAGVNPRDQALKLMTDNL